MEIERETIRNLLKILYIAYSLELWSTFCITLQSLFSMSAKTFHKDNVHKFYDENNHFIAKKAVNDIFFNRIQSSRSKGTLDQFWNCANILKHDEMCDAGIDSEKAKVYAKLYNSYLEVIIPNEYWRDIIEIDLLVVDEREKRRRNIIRQIGINPEKALVIRNEVMEYAKSVVLCPIINSINTTDELKNSMRRTITRLNEMNVLQAIDFIKGLVICEDNRPNDVARRIKESGLLRFEDVIEDFRVKFSLDWIENNLK